MRSMYVLAAALAMAAVGGCSSGGSSTSTSGAAPSGAISGNQQSKVDRAAAMTRAIRANPASADQVLRDNGMTEDQFEALMYEIAADPAMSAEFNAKVGR